MSPLDKWKALAKIENAKMLKMIGGRHAVAGWKGKEGGKLGGRPKKLTEKAKKIKLCLDAGMTCRQIGVVMGTSHQAVSQIIQRYDLKEEGNDSTS